MKQKTKSIHIALIILILVLGTGIAIELWKEGARFFKEKEKTSADGGYFAVLQNELNKDAKEKSVAMYAPETDILETEEEYVLMCDLPGMKKDEIDISVSGNYLTISGIRSEQLEEKKGYYFKERKTGLFRRAVLLPGMITDGNIKAEYENGVLTVSVPKQKPVENVIPKKVQVV